MTTTIIVDNQTQSVVNASPTVSHPKPWEHQPYETYEWYGRFLNCFLMLPRYDRSILRAYKTYRLDKGNIEPENIGKIKCPAGSWSELSTTYHWRDRAIAFDTHIDSQLITNLETKGKQSKANRINALELMLASVAAFYAQGNVKYDSSSASATMKTAIRELREEYQPTSRHDNRTQIIALIGQLPADLQSLMRKRLKAVPK